MIDVWVGTRCVKCCILEIIVLWHACVWWSMTIYMWGILVVGRNIYICIYIITMWYWALSCKSDISITIDHLRKNCALSRQVSSWPLILFYLRLSHILNDGGLWLWFWCKGQRLWWILWGHEGRGWLWVFGCNFWCWGLCVRFWWWSMSGYGPKGWRTFYGIWEFWVYWYVATEVKKNAWKLCDFSRLLKFIKIIYWFIFKSKLLFLQICYIQFILVNY